ncbi:MAG: hypothetical protein HN580_18575 [Deltaproteobacteria bacterium]|jgi:hypothetical protein|nr:hypothetical protein [Deltaproteobacteria bacterium]MBT4642139.1 hypothetical protein [Deltaproteobacteria bacterium]MBT6499885.1 hypothetical protein [Deltaproteobacteria bacterium]MBT7154955.1 hypothetical protein [Deltaproteobacteria bacterium]MBT7714725.1 hypothetical protein [Deltaproteobacteria bacterium]
MKDIPKDYANRIAAKIADIYDQAIDENSAAGLVAAFIYQKLNRWEMLPHFIETTGVLLMDEHTQMYAAKAWTSLLWHENVHPEYRAFMKSVVDRVIQGHLNADLPNYNHEESGKEFSAYAFTVGEMFIQMMRLNSDLYSVLTDIFGLFIRGEMSQDLEKGKNDWKEKRGKKKETGYASSGKLFDDIIEYISERGKLPWDKLGQQNPNEYMLILADRMRSTRKYIVQEIMDPDARGEKKSSKHTLNQNNLDFQDPSADQQKNSFITMQKDVSKDFAYRLATEIAAVKVQELDWEIASGRIAALLYKNMNYPEMLHYFPETIDALLAEEQSQDYAALIWSSLIRHEDIHPEYRTFIKNLINRFIQGHVKADLPSYHHEHSGKEFSFYTHTLGEMFIHMMRVDSGLYVILTDIFELIIQAEMSSDPNQGKDEGKIIISKEKETEYVSSGILSDDIIDYISERGKLRSETPEQKNPSEYILILADRMRSTKEYIIQDIMYPRVRRKKTSSDKELLKKLDQVMNSPLPAVYERHVNYFSQTLSGALQIPFSMKVHSIELHNFGDFLKTIPIPSSLTLFSMAPLPGIALAIANSQLVFTLVDIFYGGTGDRDVKIERNTLTRVEQRLMKRVFISFLEDLQSAQHWVYPTRFRYLRSEMNAKYIGSMVKHELDVMVVSYLIPLGLSPKIIQICLPYEQMVKPQLSSDTGKTKKKNVVIKDVATFLNTGYHVSPIPPFVQKSIAATKQHQKNKETEENSGPDPIPKPRFSIKGFLKQLGPDTIARYVAYEHPQTIAMILSHIESNKTVELIINELPDELKADVINRMNRILKIPPGIAVEIEEIFTRISEIEKPPKFDADPTDI